MTSPSSTAPRFFASAADLDDWFRRHHANETALVIGFHKVKTGTPSVTYPQALDLALCYGWIDGIRRRLDEERYTIRFTRRKASSPWSAVNIRRMQELIAEGLAQPSGLAAFERRVEGKPASYSREFEHRALTPEYEREFRRNRAAWRFFEAQAPSYRRTVIAWVMHARREETRQRRLAELIETSAKGRKPKPYSY